MGNVGIGTTDAKNYKLNVDGPVSFSNYVNFSNSINQVNSTTSNILMGNVGIGTTDAKNYKLNVNGFVNVNSLYSNNINIDFNSYLTNTTSSNLLYYTPTTLSTFPTIKYTSSSPYPILPLKQISYLNQYPVYYETIKDTVGTYQIYSSSITNFIDNYINTYTNSVLYYGINITQGTTGNYKYLSFLSSGYLILPNDIDCEILIVGGGGGGVYTGGGAGGIVKYYNYGQIKLTKGFYNINIGNGGYGSNAGEASSINGNNINLIANGGNGGTLYNGGSNELFSGGGGMYYPSAGIFGGGGAGSAGNGETAYSSYTTAEPFSGIGGIGTFINITGESVGYGGGGGGGVYAIGGYKGGSASSGGGRQFNNGTANTGGGGGGGLLNPGNYNYINYYSNYTGGSGIIIIKYLNSYTNVSLNTETINGIPLSTLSIFNKRILFNPINTDSNASFKLNNYNPTTCIYTNTNNYIINNYFGDWIIIKMPFYIVLNKLIIYNTPSYAAAAPSKWKLYGSNDGINYIEIPEGNNTVTALTSSNYSSNYYEKLINSSEYYMYYGFVVNSIVGDNSKTYLCFNRLLLYGKKYNNFKLITDTKPNIDNCLLNTGGIIDGNLIVNNTTIINSNLSIGGNVNATSYSGDASLLNIKLENQSLFVFPPISLNNSSNTVTNSLYGNGIYTITASTYMSGKEPYKCFTGISADEWTPSSSLYTTSNSYTGTASQTKIIINQPDMIIPLNGEWIQFYYNKGFALKSITFSGNTDKNNNYPNTLIIAGSFDNIKMKIISTQFDNKINPINGIKSYNIHNDTAYNYYRIIIFNTINSTTLIIPQITFKGTLNTSFININDYNNIIYNTNIRTFPDILYSNLDVSTEVIVTNEIYNCFPLNPYKQSLNYSNNTIIIYSSSCQTSGTSKNFLFNKDFIPSSSNVGRWAPAQYINGIYNNENGCYISDNTYKGDWIIIKLTSKIIIRSFSFYETINTNNSPKTWKCYGSIDGITFIEIMELNELSGATYSFNGGEIYTSTIKSLDIFSIINPFTYIGFVFGSLIGTSATQLAIQEIVIRGKEDISNSLLNTWNKSGLNIYNLYDNVGIGTTNSENYKLNINGNLTFDGNILGFKSTTNFGLPTSTSNWTGAKITLYSESSTSFPYALGYNTNTFIFSIPTNGAFNWFVGNSIKMRLTNIGELSVTGDIIAYNDLSDINLKTNIKPLNINCIDIINKINPVEFTWKNIEDVIVNKRDKIDYGFIAQEIESLIPSLIYDSKYMSKYKLIKYNKFAPYLVKAIQELHKIIEEQKSQIENLTIEITNIKSILSRNNLS